MDRWTHVTSLLFSRGKSASKVPQLVSEIKHRKTRYTGSLNYTKPVTWDPSAVLILVLVYVAAESAWNLRGPHISVWHVIFLSVSPFLSLLSSLSLASSAHMSIWHAVSPMSYWRPSRCQPCPRRRPSLPAPLPHMSVWHIIFLSVTHATCPGLDWGTHDHVWSRRLQEGTMQADMAPNIRWGAECHGGALWAPLVFKTTPTKN